MFTARVGLGPSLKRSLLASRSARSPAARAVIRRNVQTQSLPPSAMEEILNKQRLKRPDSPWYIYKPQVSAVMSIGHRATGTALSVLLYGFSLGYLVSPDTFSSTTVVDFIHGLPDVVKYTGKTLLAFPFSYHSLNGIRHLVWDSGYFLTVKGMYQTGYATLGASAAATAGLVYFL